jgi:hypothetical protein
VQLSSVRGKLSGAAIALALCLNSTAAAASATVRAPSINPLVALSVLGSDASRAALCGSAASAAVAAASAGQAAQGAAPGCVLPVLGAPPVVPPPPVVEAVPPPVVPAAAAPGFGVPLALLGLAGVVLAATLLQAFNDEDEDDVASVQ